MRITPVDKPPDGDDGSGEPSRRRSTVRSYARRFLSWFGSLVTRTRHVSQRERRSESRDADRAERDTSDLRPVDRTEPVVSGDFPDREQPLTRPARDSTDINSPDVVGVQTEDGLRLSIPENPDAELTSDVWMTVEP